MSDKPEPTAPARPGGPYSEQGEVLYTIHEISRLTTVYFDAMMEKHNVTHPQWWAIMHISRNEGVTQSELARIMRMGRAAAGKLIARLEARNWIERRADESDERVRRVYLRPESLELVNPMREAGMQQFADFMGNVPEDIFMPLLTGIRMIRENAVRATGKTGLEPQVEKTLKPSSE